MENTENKIISIQFRVFRRSANTNAFGLRSYWFMAKDGTAVEAAGNSLRDHAIGDFLTVKFNEKEGVLMGFTNAGYEIPDLKSKAPSEVADLIFNKEPSDW